jgi:hypothetical protein
VRRDAWTAAGALIALACLSQEFAVLIAVPLLVLAPPSRWPRFVGAALATAAVVVVPFALAGSGHASHDVVLGSGNTAQDAGTLVGELQLHGGPLFVLSRLLPVAVSLLVSLWVVRRLGRQAAGEPVAFMSLVALSLSLRLVFETSLFGYYFLALVVTLVLLEVVRGAIRPAAVVWLAVVSLAYLVGPNSYSEFWRFSWEEHGQALLAPVVLCVALLLVLFTITRRGLHRGLLVWTALALGAVAAWPSNHDPISTRFTTLDWQVALVVSGVLLVALPLRDQVSRSRVPLSPPAPMGTGDPEPWR